jgi:hypothetical protein
MAPALLTTALGGSELSASCPCLLTPRERPQVLSVRMVAYRVSLDHVE